MYRFETRTFTTNIPVYILEWEKLLNNRMHKNILATLDDAYLTENQTIIGTLFKDNTLIARYEYFGDGCYIIKRSNMPIKDTYTYIHRGF